LKELLLILILICFGGMDDGVLSPENVILWHLSNGFNAAIITGHNSLEPGIFKLFFEKEKMIQIFEN
jgi:predicted metal-dependent phosphoesterase TrpH